MGKIALLGIGTALGLALAIAAMANHRFDQAVDRRIHGMLDRARETERTITEQGISHLPKPVHRWLRSAGVVGRRIPSSIRLRQEGTLRLSPDARWMRFTADQYYTIDPAAFIWRVSVTGFPGFFIRGVDEFQGTHGSMQMKPFALFEVVDASGPALDQGSALRYLQEIVWFPFAALAENISWEPVGEDSARATMTFGLLTVSGTFTFAEDGRVLEFEALRYRDEQSEPTLRSWRTPMREHAPFDDIVVPTDGDGIWGLEDGEFPYIHVHIVELEFDVPEVFER